MVLHIVHCINRDLGTLKDIFAVDLAPVADGLAAAGADGFQFLDRMGKLQQPRRAGEPRIIKSARRP